MRHSNLKTTLGHGRCGRVICPKEIAIIQPTYSVQAITIAHPTACSIRSKISARLLSLPSMVLMILTPQPEESKSTVS
jgi:hypothetical protein